MHADNMLILMLMVPLGGGLLSRAEVATLAASQRATQGPPVDVDSDLDALARARLGAAASSKVHTLSPVQPDSRLFEETMLSGFDESESSLSP